MTVISLDNIIINLDPEPLKCSLIKVRYDYIVTFLAIAL